MGRKISILAALLIFVCLVGGAIAAEAQKGSSSEDQTGVDLTVYNNNLALVKDVRKITLNKGVGTLRFMDVASRIMPETVLVRSLNNPKALSIIEQNYEYDLISSRKLLDKYVGKDMLILELDKDGVKKGFVNATLLSNNEGPVFRINKEIYLDYPGIKVLPELPANLIAKPTLTWTYDNDAAKAHEVEVSYLTEGMNWKADYVMRLDKDDKVATLAGWVTLDNHSGTSYNDARLSLIAGEVHRAPRVRHEEDQMLGRAYKMAEAAPQFSEKSFFEYHMYDLKRKTTIKDNQTKQIEFMTANNVKLKKEYVVKPAEYYWYTSEWHDEAQKKQVGVYLKFMNTEANSLGMPIPAGVIRLYKSDDDNSVRFIGEDAVEHTPREEEVVLKIGDAFDVVAERKQTDFKRISNRVFETEWELTIRNRKKEHITVTLKERLYGSWEVVSSSHEYKKTGAFMIRYDIPAPVDKEVKVKYRVRLKT